MVLAAIFGCGEDPDPMPGTGAIVPSNYAFESRFEAGESGVRYTGQALRHVLMLDLTDQIGGLTERIDNAELTPVAGSVVAELQFYYDFDGDTSGDTEIGQSTTPARAQMRYSDLSSGKDLNGKIAGNDSVGQHRDWSKELVGWSDPAVTTPESLVRHFFARIETLAIARANGAAATAPDGAPIDEAFVSAEGHDYRQLVQKFLGGAVAYSQAADDYLDDDVDGKGLRSDNIEPEKEGARYTALEHAWDEGFGYFGAARDYSAYTDDEIAAKGGREDYKDGYHDTDGDGAIDFGSEFNFGHAVNAAKRDRGSAAEAATDFSREAIEAFLKGRALISKAAGALDAEQMGQLQAHRDQLLTAWDNTLAATTVHYINEVLVDMKAFGSADYSFSDHAKHWSELKGFALTLQFNRRAQLSREDQTELHRLIGAAPVLPGQAGVTEYQQALRSARGLLQNAYGFDRANVGGPDGSNGW